MPKFPTEDLILRKDNVCVLLYLAYIPQKKKKVVRITDGFSSIQETRQAYEFTETCLVNYKLFKLI